MRQLAYTHIDKIMKLDGITKHLIVIENPHEFYNVVNTLNTQTSSSCEGFVLTEYDTMKEIQLSKESDILIDYFNMEFNSKKIQNLINSKAIQLINNSELRVDFAESAKQITKFIDSVISRLEIRTISEKEIELIDILKLGNLKILEWYSTPLEMIVNYINIITKLKRIDILFLVNVKQILTEEEMLQLYKHCSYIKLNLVLIESKVPVRKLEDEEVIHIDDDLCEVDY